MTTTARMFVDLSSNNPLPNLKKHYKAGHRVIGLKATEGSTYTWGDSGRLADEWHALGGTVWHYHFARSGDGAAQASAFLAAIRDHLDRDDRLVLDVETDGIGPAFVKAFIDRCSAKRPRHKGVVYSYASFLTGHRIKPYRGWGLWLADYSPAKPDPVAGWNELVAWQFTDKMRGLAGMKAPVDCSYLYDVAEPVPPHPKPQPEPTPAQRRRFGWWVRRYLRRYLRKREP